MKSFRLFAIGSFALLCSLPLAAADKLTAEELIAKNLDSIGKAEDRASQDARRLNGIAAVRLVVGGFGSMQGTGELLSAGDDFRLTTKYNVINYPGDDILLSHHKETVAVITPGTRSPLGGFVFYYSQILNDGVFGGVLNSGWVLNHTTPTGKFKSNGIKKIKGQPLLELQYIPHKISADLDIHLYFDPQTYRHVLTRYVAETKDYAPSFGVTGNTAKTEITETFSDFGVVGKLTLPLRWKVRFEQSQGAVNEYETIFRTAQLTVPDNAFTVK